MKILVIDGQGGGMGSALVAQLKRVLPDQPITAVGTNALATSAMRKAGADAAATGENALVVNCRDAGVVVGPIGIVIADALMGEISPGMALAVAQCAAKKILIPTTRCNVCIISAEPLTLAQAVEAAAREVEVFLCREK